MEKRFQTVGTNTYLTVDIEDDDNIDSMSMGMLTNNNIPGLAPATFIQMDARKYIQYNVTAMVSAKQMFSGSVNRRRLIGVFSGIVDAMLSAEEYMLDTRTILLDMDFIFTDVSTCKTVMICLPVLCAEQKSVDLGAFFKNIIFTTQFDQTENCDHVAQILNYLNSTPSLSLTGFREVLERIDKAKDAAGIQQPVVQPNVKPVSQPKTTVEQPFSTIQSGIVQQSAPAVSLPASTVRNQPKFQTPPKTENFQYGESTKFMAQEVPPLHPSQNVTEKPMSMFYLLQHYNKENAATYKAQKEAKKANKSSGKPSKADKPKKEKKSKKTQPMMDVPGRQVSNQNIPNFAVPGKPTANQSIPNFAVPTQPNQGVPGNQSPQMPSQGAGFESQKIPVPNQGLAGFVMPNQSPAAQPEKPAQNAVQPAHQAAQAYQQSVPMQSANPISFGETTVLGGQVGETTVLGAALEPDHVNPHLIRVKNNEKIPLNKPVFRIGKERSYVDYFVSDNTAISRSHANIVNKNGEFYVVDTNSTNHTYVNGGMIQSNVETRLAHGTSIRLANEDFEFRMY